MGKRKAKYNKSGIEGLPSDKPVVYCIGTDSGNPNYIGTAQRGRVNERIKEHLDDIPGAQVRIEQFSSINDAREKETRVINRNQPKYNERK